MEDENAVYTADIGPVGNPATTHLSVPFPRHPPRLSVALFWAQPGSKPWTKTALEKKIANKERGLVSLADPTTFDDEVRALLEHILERLKAGLWEAWISKYGYDLRYPVRKKEESDEQYKGRVEEYNLSAVGMAFMRNEPEELWARQVTEMFVFAPYGGTGLFTVGVQNDQKVYEKYPSVHSLLVACQHLSTYIALTRGIPPADISPGLDASPMAGSSGFQTGVTTRPNWVSAAPSTWPSQDLAPGDCFAGDDGAPNRDKFAHIASVLRRWPLQRNLPSNATYKLQWFDTGVLTSQGDKVTQDHGWDSQPPNDRLSAAFSQAPNRRGFGRIAEAKNLTDAVTKASNSLPLGFARLVLFHKDGTVRYVSALLPMWFTDLRFYISTYLWSLRNLPADGLVAAWSIYGVNGKALFQEVLNEAQSGPQRSAGEILQKAGATNDAPLLRELAVVTSEPRVLRANIKTTEKWVSVTPNQTGADNQYGEDEPQNTSQAPTDVAEKKGAAQHRTWIPLKLPASGKRRGGWDFFIQPAYADKELRVRDLSKVEQQKAEEQAAKEEAERKAAEEAGKPYTEPKPSKPKEPVIDAVEVIETNPTQCGVPYFDLTVKTPSGDTTFESSGAGAGEHEKSHQASS
ncbi:MAG: hypothetical protein IPK82_34215 [Polyangiaceae bacterium]|nr:hypothetical protein [Polyangiaceae bacterium]